MGRKEREREASEIAASRAIGRWVVCAWRVEKRAQMLMRVGLGGFEPGLGVEVDGGGNGRGEGEEEARA